MVSLAVKYRPKTWEELECQKSIVKILTRQLELGETKNCYLFCGSSGCGKTTAGRLFANAINNGIGSPIEIDGASNNGVDNVKAIVKSAQERAIDGKYKIYLIDECHVLTSAAWQAFLKCLEEPPTYTVFIFCTTDPQKIPPTILNRVQRFNFTRIDQNSIKKRLTYICEQEHFTNYAEGVEYISKISDGGLRTAIAMLEKCADYSTEISMDNVLQSLGNYSYSSFFEILNAMIDGNDGIVCSALNKLYMDGGDLKLFIDQFMSFCLDVSKYIIFNSCDILRIPSSIEEELKRVINFNDAQKYYIYVIDRLLELKSMLKNDSNIKDTIEVMLLRITRGM